MPAEYEFTADWFSWATENWKAVLSSRGPIDRVLEIGSYEGRSTVWIVENLLAGRPTSLVAIDAWQEGPEVYQKDTVAVEARFDRNMRLASQLHPTVSIEKRKGQSVVELAALLASGEHKGSFDLIYIDGSHYAHDALTDLVLSFYLCKVGGFLLCDDYLWSQFRALTETPKLGIDCFVNCFHQKVRVVEGSPLYQLYLYKVAD